MKKFITTMLAVCMLLVFFPNNWCHHNYAMSQNRNT